MGRTDSHLHMFAAGYRQYGTPDPDFEEGTIPEGGARNGKGRPERFNLAEAIGTLSGQ